MSVPDGQVRLATFSQHHVDGLDLALTGLQYMLRSFPGTKDEQQRLAGPRYLSRPLQAWSFTAVAVRRMLCNLLVPADQNHGCIPLSTHLLSSSFPSSPNLGI